MHGAQEMEQQVSPSLSITPERALVLHEKELEIDCNQSTQAGGQLAIAISNHNVDCNLDCQADCNHFSNCQTLDFTVCRDEAGVSENQ